MELDNITKFFGAHSHLFREYSFHMPFGVAAILDDLSDGNQSFLCCDMLQNCRQWASIWKLLPDCIGIKEGI